VLSVCDTAADDGTPDVVANALRVADRIKERLK
jgi:hypothetical protein